MRVTIRLKHKIEKELQDSNSRVVLSKRIDANVPLSFYSDVIKTAYQ